MHAPLFARDPQAPDSQAVAVVWNGLNGSRRVFADAAKDAGLRILFFECAPLPGRVTVDPKGVNFANALPRDIGFYTDWLARSGTDPDGWRAFARADQTTPVKCAPPDEGTYRH